MNESSETDGISDLHHYMTDDEILKLPKVELHLHIEGAIKLQTLMELATELNIEVPKNEQETQLDAIRRMFCLTSRVENLTAFLDAMWFTQSLLATEKIIERVTYEACEEANKQNVKLLELRYSPSFITISRNNDHSSLTLDSVHHAVMTGIRRAETDFDIAVGLIGIMDRTLGPEREAAVFEFYCAHKADIIGIDLANDELYSCIPFKDIYQQSRDFFGATCHAGESTNANSVREAIEHLQVSRVGHGFLAAHDISLVQLIIDRGIVLELCPHSNVITGSVGSIEEHPVRQLLDAGVKLCISSDDPGMFDSCLLHDYRLLNRHHRFTLADFHRANLIALEASFLPQAKKDAVRLKHFSRSFE